MSGYMFAALDERAVPVVHIDTPFGGEPTFRVSDRLQIDVAQPPPAPGGRSGAGGIRSSGPLDIWVISHHAP